MTNTIIPAGKWVIDPTHSHVDFSVRHLMISNVKGKFTDFSGTAVSDGTESNTRMDIVIKASSIDTNEEGRDQHLNSEDFFNTEVYPEIVFKSENIVSTGDGDFDIKGLMTIRDVTKPVVFKATFNGVANDPYGNTKLAGEAVAKINREDFGLTWNSALETGGVLVGKDIKISVDIQAVLEQ